MTLPTNTQVADVVAVPFRDGEVLAVDLDGKPHVILKTAFETIGLDADQQVRKVQKQHWARTVVTPVRGSDGRPRDMVTADLRTFLMALATVPVARVAEAVRENLKAYQSEVADVIEAYWTHGGAINPRAGETELDELSDEIEQRKADLRAAQARRDLSVIRELEGIVDPNWRESLGRHAWAIYKGEKPEIAAEDRLLMVQPYLVERGVSKADIASIGSVFGKRVKSAYVAEYGREPEEVPALIGGRERSVKGYYERDRFLFDAVFDEHYLRLVGPQQLMLDGAA